ncbi:type 1 glutamine amidotransferase domain-containing protein [Rhodanobacter sp. C05]|uniref:type 1 glutamine amidotransferase domain-containing protein n=1 Tax=Rhodanobacter sp. C05 TaxID=1945855 RepID=UPI000984530F|nr:type 1 glutamine amidotransferase domain-containing protein [Rhodanobacter sp. C05]OOG41629.1 protease [Rhodanobacter sp. C05]
MGTRKRGGDAARLDGRSIAILATDGFEQSELTEPKRLLEEAGAEVSVIASGSAKQIRGWDKKDWGSPVDVDVVLSDADASDFDALVLPGGVMNPDKLRLESAAINLIRAFGESGKPIAAICHGPWTLIDAELVEGHTMTSWPSLRTDLENAGATWEDREVVHDGQLITSRKPDDIPAFARALIDQLAA